MSREVLANIVRYPWFLETFDGYPYPIQRADAIRYFVLHHFGGIYIDLDDVRMACPLNCRNANILRDATAVSTLFLPTQLGFAAPFPLVSRTMPWVRSLVTLSSSRPSTP